MYEHDINCKSSSELWVIVNPNYPQFGISFDKRGTLVKCSLVNGAILEGARLNVVEQLGDTTIPVEVLHWFAQHMMQLRSFSGQDIDLQQEVSEQIVEYAT